MKNTFCFLILFDIMIQKEDPRSAITEKVYNVCVIVLKIQIKSNQKWPHLGNFILHRLMKGSTFKSSLSKTTALILTKFGKKPL